MWRNPPVKISENAEKSSREDCQKMWRNPPVKISENAEKSTCEDHQKMLRNPSVKISRKCHIPKLENWSPNQDTCSSAIVGDACCESRHVTLTPCVVPLLSGDAEQCNRVTDTAETGCRDGRHETEDHITQTQLRGSSSRP